MSGRLLAATAIGAAASFTVGYFIAGIMPLWATVTIAYVCGAAMVVVTLAATGARRSRRTKHRRG